jgi:hypothetical protein
MAKLPRIIVPKDERKINQNILENYCNLCRSAVRYLPMKIKGPGRPRRKGSFGRIAVEIPKPLLDLLHEHADQSGKTLARIVQHALERELGRCA